MRTYEAELRIKARGQVIDELSTRVSTLQQTLDQLTARIELLAAESAAAVPAPATAAAKPRILLVTNGNYFLAQALAALAQDFDVSTIAPDEYEAASKVGYAVTVFDRYTPKAPPQGAAMFFAAVPPGSDLTDTSGPRGDPLTVKNPGAVKWDHVAFVLSNLTLDKLFISEALKLRVPADWHILAHAADVPLIIDHPSAPQQIVIAFDIQHSNWPLRAGFPVFMSQSLRWLTTADVQAANRNFNNLSPTTAASLR
jgi:uncharacterized coiled-coil protein SlyX